MNRASIVKAAQVVFACYHANFNVPVSSKLAL